MKNFILFAFFFVVVACEDQYKVIHRYARPYYLVKDYPIYLDPSQILVDIQIKSSINPESAFKITSNKKYIFVGEKMKGIHVYEKKDDYHADPLCFIACLYLKAFEVADNLLYCNNFVDLLVIDVENPLLAKIKHREVSYFNDNNKNNHFPVSYGDGKTYFIIGTKQVVLTGTETNDRPPPDFSEYDKLYWNLKTMQIPDSLLTNKPCAGFVNMEDTILTFGYTSLSRCSYASGHFEITPTAFGFSHYSFVPLSDLLYKNGTLFFFWENRYFGIYNSDVSGGPAGTVLFDVVPLIHQEKAFVTLTDFYIALSYADGVDFSPTLGATSLINVNDTILALSNQLTLYRCSIQNNNRTIVQIKSYPAISGLTMMRHDDVLTVVTRQGIRFYDISDLNQIIQR